MEFLDLCLKRESCRTYTGESITSSDLHQIVEVGRLAPSACNSQPWHFYVVSAGETLQGVKDGVKVLGTNKFTDKAGAFIVIAGAKENYTERVGQAIYGRDFSNIDIGITVANMA
ncbi:MAG: nitroreductase family protein, partial [Clostridia bacterium]